MCSRSCREIEHISPELQLMTKATYLLKEEAQGLKTTAIPRPESLRQRLSSDGRERGKGMTFTPSTGKSACPSTSYHRVVVS